MALVCHLKDVCIAERAQPIDCCTGEAAKAGQEGLCTGLEFGVKYHCGATEIMLVAITYQLSNPSIKCVGCAHVTTISQLVTAQLYQSQ